MASSVGGAERGDIAWVDFGPVGVWVEFLENSGGGKQEANGQREISRVGTNRAEELIIHASVWAGLWGGRVMPFDTSLS